MILGYLLARAGVDVMVLEKHADFLRDFRGDTIHPSTLEVMHELGLLEEFLKRPHQEMRQIGGQIGDDFVIMADFSHLPTQCKFIAFMPQWDFLDFLAEHGKRYPNFRLQMQAEAIDLIEDQGKIVGMTRRDTDDEQTLGRITQGRMMVTLNRGDYWQCAYLIRKGDFEQIKNRGLEAFRADIVAVAPFLRDRTDELKGWEQIKLLTVLVDRLQKWYRPGLLCIGDAAHAMSPIGGVGINLAIQDAVATANLLGERLSRGTVSIADLQRVQFRRELPTRITQTAQVFIQNRLIRQILGSDEQIQLPWILRVLMRWPFLRRIPARLIGIGFRPEHVNRIFVAEAQGPTVA